MTTLAIDMVIRGENRVIRYNLDKQVENENVILSFLNDGILYEPDVSCILLRILEDGDIAIDVGANIGFFTVLASVVVGNNGLVLSFEPDNANCTRFNANLTLNHLSNVILERRPVSNVSAPVTFYLNSDSNGGNALWDPADFPGNAKSKENPQPISMTSTTLSKAFQGYDRSKLKFIKIDTEGAEQLVLEGAHDLLEGAAVPFIVAELHEFGLEKMGHTQKSLRTLMEGYGYSTFALSGKGDMPHLIPPGTQITSDFYINMLFSTQEAVSKYWTSYKIKL